MGGAMAKHKNLVGLCTCPECGFDESEVKKTKAGLAYRWCPECNAQYFPRCESTSGRLVNKCHTLAEPVREPEQEPEPQAVAKTPAMAPAPVTEPKPAPKAAKPGPFDFLLKGATA